MAKKASNRNGKSLVIVESPAKARTISKFLGRDFTVEASIGHVRDLPQGAKQIPEEYKGEEWAYLGVNVNADFNPVYIIPPGKTAQVRKLKALLKDAKDLYLATDEDREGEAISWHLNELLKPKVPVHRLVFHEITKEAIQQALEHPRQIDDDLVKAQEARRIIDRLYGYEVSPLLWRKVRPKLSAGRVQSVAVRLIVERERQRMAFRSATYWDLLGRFAKVDEGQLAKDAEQQFAAELVSVDGRRIPAGKDFDPATGRLKDPALLQMDEAGAGQLAARLEGAQFHVASLEDKPYTSKPYAPFTTSTLQQEANRKLGFTARRTMQAAQSLYENGHITYMRTDSTNLASVAIEAARELVASQYGREYLPAQPRQYVTKVKNAQEAHEAIRPAGHPFDFPEQLRGDLNADEFKLYDLIWKRTIASQMADARGRRITITVEGSGAVFQTGGKTVDFPGYLRAYVEGSDDPEADLAENERLLPSVTVGEPVRCRELESKSHTTQPPARFSEASLTRASKSWASAGPARTPRSSTRSWPANTCSRKAERWSPPGSPSPWPSCSKPICPTWSTIASPPRWKTTWTPSAAAKPDTSITCAGSTSATAPLGSRSNWPTRPSRSTPATSAACSSPGPRAGTRSTSATAAMDPSSNTASAGPACPTKLRPTS